jgi:phosphopantothenoylcysteine synthetase/decarboxylase
MTSGAIVVGVGGGIAAYKVADVVSKLVQRGKSVRVVMTHSATKFVGAATFAALTSNPVAITNFSSSYP